MTTINLHQNQEAEERRVSSKGVNSGFFFSLGILIITLGFLVGLKLYVPVAEGRNVELTKVINDENSKLVGLKNLEQIIDMQNRLSEIKSNLKIKDNAVSRQEMTKILDNVGTVMTKGTVVFEYKYDTGKVTLSFVANNFNDASVQILNLKKSDLFANANLAKINRTETSIEFDVEMQTK